MSLSSAGSQGKPLAAITFRHGTLYPTHHLSPPSRYAFPPFSSSTSSLSSSLSLSPRDLEKLSVFFGCSLFPGRGSHRPLIEYVFVRLSRSDTGQARSPLSPTIAYLYETRRFVFSLDNIFLTVQQTEIYLIVKFRFLSTISLSSSLSHTHTRAHTQLVLLNCEYRR